MKPHQTALDFALDLAATARGISLRYYEGGFSQQQKTDRSLVTEADERIEDAIREKVLAKGWGMIGEEKGSDNPDAEYVVVVDPIDATNHFVTHDGNFFTLIGVHHKADGFVAGVCDQPASANLWTGLLGHGAFHHAKDAAGKIIPGKSQKMTASTAMEIKDALLSSWNPLSVQGPDEYFFKDLSAQCRASIAGGDGGNYARIAQGYMNMVFERIGGLYDIAAFIPMFRECGCVIRKANDDGTFGDITLADNDKFTVLAASSPALFENAARLRLQNFERYRRYDLAMQTALKAG